MKALTVIPFDFNGNDIRTIVDEKGNPWFIARDIAEILGYAKTEKMTRLLDDDEKKNLEIKEGTLQFGGPGKNHNKKEGRPSKGASPCMTTVISESGLYTAIIRSDKESAKPFRRWVTHEVLPSIRKTGQYNLYVQAFLRSEPTDWERRFPPEYYQALCRLFGWDYAEHTALPDVIGQITRRWVYEVCMPLEIMEEMYARRDHQKLHQWLTEEAKLKIIEQIQKVAMLARQASDYRDFDARCKLEWGRKGHQMSFLFPMATPLGRRH